MEKITLSKSQTNILNSIKMLDNKIIYFENSKNKLFGFLNKEMLDVNGSSSIFFDLVKKGIIIKKNEGYVINNKITWVSDKIVKIPMTF